MATTRKTKTTAKSKVVTAKETKIDQQISKKVTSQLNAYRKRQIAALKKKFVIIGSSNGGKTLDEIKKSVDALAVLFKKFPNWTAGIPAIDNYWSNINSNLMKFRSKNSKIINSNKLILKEIEILENSNFITDVGNNAISNFNKKKITSAAAIKATAVEALAKAYVKKQMKAKQLKHSLPYRTKRVSKGARFLLPKHP